jgi:hypothetical protein
LNKVDKLQIVLNAGMDMEGSCLERSVGVGWSEKGDDGVIFYMERLEKTCDLNQPVI